MLSFGPPLDAGPLELFLIRCGYAYLLYRCLKRRPKHDAQPMPAGLAHLVDLTWLSRRDVHRRLRLLARIGLCFYIAGIGLPVVTPLLLLYVVARESLNNSQGAIQHAWNAVALVLLVQAGLYGFQTFNAVFRPEFAFPSGATYDQVALFWSQQAIIVVYFTAGLYKLVSARAWLTNAPRMVLQIIKTSRQSFYTRLDASHLDRSDRVVTQVLRHPHLTRLLLASGLLLELGSPLFLHNRMTQLAGGMLLILFHLLNARYLQLPFREQRLLTGVFFLQIPFGLATLAELVGVPW